MFSHIVRRTPFRFSALAVLGLGLWSLGLPGVSFPAADAAEVKLAWEANRESHLAGYKLYYGQASKTYGTPVKLGKITTHTLSGLEEGRTYYFALTAYDTSGRESQFSAEVIHYVPDGDADGDGLTDRQERDLYKTDPKKADTDGDGLGDGQEVTYWGTAWGEDADGDGVINLLDADADGDGFADGEEVTRGYDPRDPDSIPPVKVWVEAEEAAILPPITIAPDTGASGGRYIWVPNGTGNANALDRAQGEARYVFEVPVAGEYLVWGRINAQPDNDSFHVAIDDQPYRAWDTTRGGDAWIWDEVRAARNGEDPRVFTLEAGVHTLSIKQREDGCKLDKLLITNDFAYIPRDLDE